MIKQVARHVGRRIVRRFEGLELSTNSSMRSLSGFTGGVIGPSLSLARYRGGCAARRKEIARKADARRTATWRKRPLGRLPKLFPGCRRRLLTSTRHRPTRARSARNSARQAATLPAAEDRRSSDLPALWRAPCDAARHGRTAGIRVLSLWKLRGSAEAFRSVTAACFSLIPDISRYTSSHSRLPLRSTLRRQGGSVPLTRANVSSGQNNRPCSTTSRLVGPNSPMICVSRQLAA